MKKKIIGKMDVSEHCLAVCISQYLSDSSDCMYQNHHKTFEEETELLDGALHS